MVVGEVDVAGLGVLDVPPDVVELTRGVDNEVVGLREAEHGGVLEGGIGGLDASGHNAAAVGGVGLLVDVPSPYVPIIGST